MVSVYALLLVYPYEKPNREPDTLSLDVKVAVEEELEHKATCARPVSVNSM
jgi:hypothetical protein